jgi:hypothetical protein
MDTGSDNPMGVFKEFGLSFDSEVILLCFKTIKEGEV